MLFINKKIAVLFFIFFSCLNSSLIAVSNDYNIKINSAKFRKSIIGIDFITHQDTPNKKLVQHTIKKKLSKLIKFTKLFNVLEDIRGGTKENNMRFWRSLGADILIQNQIEYNNKQLYLIINALYIKKNAFLIKNSKYKLYNKQPLEKILKIFVDNLVEKYTGKKGVFQSKIVFVGRKYKDSMKQIYISDPDGSNLEQLTNAPHIHLTPNLAPKNDKVIFTSYKTGYPSLYVIDLKTKKHTRFLKNDKKLQMGGTFSPDGKRIVFSQYSNGTNIYVKNFLPYKPFFKTTQKARPLVAQKDGINIEAKFSPNSKWLAFVSERYGNPHIFKAELKWNYNKMIIKKTTRLTYQGWYNSTPAWSPNSNKIAFSGFDKDINLFDIFLIKNDGTELERLTLQSGNSEHPTFSPNGHLIMFQSNRSTNKSLKYKPYQLYVMKHDGTEQTKIFTGLYEAHSPNWGNYIRKDY